MEALVHSQQTEQEHILANLPETGRFLDIGAYDATELSNTRALYERGWSGVLVEPSPGPARRLVEQYADKQIIVVCAVVGEQAGLARLFVSDGAYSTTRHENAERWKDEAGFIGECWVPYISVAKLIEQFGPFEFVNIDTEGTSVDILKALFRTPMDPLCICCEHDGRLIEAIKAAEAKGYWVVDENGCNIIFSRGPRPCNLSV